MAKKSFSKRQKESHYRNPGNYKNVDAGSEMLADLGPADQLLYSCLYSAYKRHRDILHSAPDHIAEIAICDTAAEEMEKEGISLEFNVIVDKYYRFEGTMMGQYYDEKDNES